MSAKGFVWILQIALLLLTPLEASANLVIGGPQTLPDFFCSLQDPVPDPCPDVLVDFEHTETADGMIGLSTGEQVTDQFAHLGVIFGGPAFASEAFQNPDGTTSRQLGVNCFDASCSLRLDFVEPVTAVALSVIGFSPTFPTPADTLELVVNDSETITLLPDPGFLQFGLAVFFVNPVQTFRTATINSLEMRFFSFIDNAYLPFATSTQLLFAPGEPPLARALEIPQSGRFLFVSQRDPQAGGGTISTDFQTDPCRQDSWDCDFSAIVEDEFSRTAVVSSIPEPPLSGGDLTGYAISGEGTASVLSAPDPTTLPIDASREFDAFSTGMSVIFVPEADVSGTLEFELQNSASELPSQGFALVNLLDLDSGAVLFQQVCTLHCEPASGCPCGSFDGEQAEQFDFVAGTRYRLSANARAGVGCINQPDMGRVGCSELLSTAAGVNLAFGEVVTNSPPAAIIAPIEEPLGGFAPGDTVSLDGTGSSDPDGDALTYEWTVTEPGGTEETLSGAVADFAVNVEGVHEVVLEVSDGMASDTATASFTVISLATKAENVQAALATAVTSVESTNFDGNNTKQREKARCSFMQRVGASDGECADDNPEGVEDLLAEMAYADAIGTVRRLINEVNGCAERGTPDTETGRINGEVIFADSITLCGPEGQEGVYDALVALEAVLLSLVDEQCPCFTSFDFSDVALGNCQVRGFSDRELAIADGTRDNLEVLFLSSVALDLSGAPVVPHLDSRCRYCVSAGAPVCTDVPFVDAEEHNACRFLIEEAARIAERGCPFVPVQ